MYVLVALLALAVALSFFASPLIALVVVIPLAVVGFVFMSSQRQRSEW